MNAPAADDVPNLPLEYPRPPVGSITERLTPFEYEVLSRALSTPSTRFHVVPGGAFGAVVEGLISARVRIAKAEAWLEGRAAAQDLPENPYAS